MQRIAGLLLLVTVFYLLDFSESAIWPRRNIVKRATNQCQGKDKIWHAVGATWQEIMFVGWQPRFCKCVARTGKEPIAICKYHGCIDPLDGIVYSLGRMMGECKCVSSTDRFRPYHGIEYKWVCPSNHSVCITDRGAFIGVGDEYQHPDELDHNLTCVCRNVTGYPNFIDCVYDDGCVLELPVNNKTIIYENTLIGDCKCVKDYNPLVMHRGVHHHLVCDDPLPPIVDPNVSIVGVKKSNVP